MPGFVARVADERDDLLAYPAQQRLERTVPPRSPLMAAAEDWPHVRGSERGRRLTERDSGRV
jgi:hypothetical protein